MRWRYALLTILLLLAAMSRASGSTLWIYNVHTEEELVLSRLAPARMDARTWRRANRFFRSWRTQKRRPMHPRLLRTLAHIQRHFGNRRIEIISGYRAPAQGDELNSYHQVGRAVDLRIDGVSKGQLFLYCRSLARMGCGFYPAAEFVHIDVRGSSAIWVDRSAPGAPRDYVDNPERWLRAHGLEGE